MSRVSVYLSSYNYAGYVGQAIKSVLNQTFTDYEVFIVDDASADDSRQIIQSYSDPRIRSIRNPTNQNDRQTMRRVVMEMASGDLVAILHSDDLWEPDKLSQQVAYLDAHPDIGAVFTHVQLIGEDGEPLTDKSHVLYSIAEQPNRSRHEWLRFFWERHMGLFHPSMLIRRSCYEECGFYRQGLSIADLDLWVRLCMKYEIHVIPRKLTRIRVHTGQADKSQRIDARIRWHFENLQVLRNYRDITTFQDLVSIFPAAREYLRPEGCDIGYALAMIALQRQAISPGYRPFALDLLFEALNDPIRADKIKALYAFSSKDLVALSGKFDPLSDETLTDLSATIAHLNRELEGIKASTLWRFGLRIAPPDSRRARMLRPLARIIAWLLGSAR